MSKFFSRSTMGLYDSELSTSMPNDAREISDEAFLRLIEGPGQGLQLSVDEKGLPCLVKTEPSEDELLANGRSWRNAEIALTDWLVARHRDQSDIDAPMTLTSAQFLRLVNYRQALRDWPAQSGFPSLTSRPQRPEEIDVYI